MKQIDWNAPTDDVRDHTNFDAVYIEDLYAAKSSVLIKCPYCSVNRLEKLGEAFTGLVKRGVKVCVYLQEPKNWDRRHELQPVDRGKIKQLEAAIATLLEMGAHVTVQKGLHQKICVIDGYILYRGSLNILSFYDTLEEMVRIVSVVEALATIKRHRFAQCHDCLMQSLPRNEVICETHTLAGQIIKLRTIAGCSQEELAEISGIKRSQLARIEAGAVVPNADELIRLCSALDRTLCMVPNGAARYLEEIAYITAQAAKRSQSAS